MLEVVNDRSTGKVWFGLRVDFKRVEKCSLPLFGRVDCCLFSSLLLFGHLLTFLCDLLLFPSFLVILWPFKNRVPTITLLKAFLLRSVLQVHLHFFRLLLPHRLLLLLCLNRVFFLLDWIMSDSNVAKEKQQRLLRRRHHSMIYRHARPESTRAVKA